MLSTKLTAIAEAIRTKTSTTDTMTLDEMPDKIAAIETGKPTLFAPVIEQADNIATWSNSSSNGDFPVTLKGSIDGVEYESPLSVTKALKNKTLTVTASGTNFLDGINSVDLSYKGNGLFVATPGYYSSTVAAYSADGDNWTQSSLPSSQSWESAAYGNGTFVVLGQNSAVAAYSTDGINWTQTSLPQSAEWKAVTYGNGTFVAIAYKSDTGAYSTDGVTWTAMTITSSSNSTKWINVTYGDKFVVIAQNQTICAYSSDGINWTQSSLPLATSYSGLAYGNGTYVATTEATYFIHSTDGINWTLESTMPVTGRFNNTTFANNVFVSVSYQNDYAVYSYDGINWTATSLPSVGSAGAWRGVTYGNGKFIAVKYKTAYAATSEDGINWTLINMPVSNYWYAIAYGES